MSRVIIKLKDGTVINIPAHCLEMRDGWLIAWRDELAVAIAKGDEVVVSYISEQNVR